MCNIRIPNEDAKIEWGRGTSYFGNWQTEFGKIFFEIMNKAGHRVVGDPERLFGSKDEVIAAEFLIGGRISDMKANYCRNHHWWDGRPLDQFKGETCLQIDWEVFSTLKRKVIYKTKTPGFGKTIQFKREGLTLSLQDAFADAVVRFSMDDGLMRAIEPGGGQQLKPQFDKLELAGASLFKTQLNDNREKILNSVVTVQLGTGHGSGFMISSDGYLLTNAHVVGDGKRVPVLFSNGVRVNGMVIRTSKQRDVALVKVPVQSRYVLPINREHKLKLFDQVFVIGTPGDVRLESTVTRGIVSAFRKDRDGNKYIQSDASISGGNSGGPMIDGRGNVVGIAVASYVFGTGLNLFIPIESALKSLNIEMD